ncbi:hypothetical protein KP509_1Z209100 [Ceratopteris richardii]|nr:hypothetical protein KP509_1Z209100 [Ceratopteris richardii]
MLGAASLQGQLVPAPRRRLPSLAFASGTGFSHSSRSATRGPYSPANQPCRRWMLGAASLQGQLVPAPRRRLPSLAFASGTGFSHSSRSATRGPYRYTWLSAIQLKGNIYLRTDKRTQKALC